MDRPINLVITEFDRTVFRAKARQEIEAFTKLLRYSRAKYGFSIDDIRGLLDDGRRKKRKAKVREVEGGI